MSHAIMRIQKIKSMQGLAEREKHNTRRGLMSIFWTQKVKLFYAALLANNSH